MDDEKLSFRVGASIIDFTTKMKAVTRQLNSLNKTVVSKVKVKTNNAVTRLNRIGTALRNIGEIGQNVISGILFSSFTGLIPVIATAGAAIGGLSASFAAAGVGTVAFGVIATSTLNNIFDANKKISDLRQKLANTTDLKERAKINQQIAAQVNSLSGAQKRGLKALQDFSGFWSKFSQQFQEPVVDIFVKSLDILKSVIQSLKPVFDGSVKAISGLMDSLGSSLKSSDVQGFFSWLGQTAGPAMTAFGTAFGNIMRGVMNLLVAFGPLGTDMQNGLVGMTDKFAKWTSTVSQSKGFQQFIDYVKTNGPKVLSLIGNIISLIINFATAMAPLGAKVLNVVNSIVSWTSSLFKAHPQIGNIIGIIITLIGVFKLIGPPILLAQSIFGGFVGKMLLGFGKLAVKALLWAGRMAASWLIAMGPIGWIIAAVVGLVALIVIYWDKIKAVTVKVWGAISEFLSSLWSSIVSIASNIWSSITTVWQSVVNAIKIIFTPIIAFFSGIWNNIKTAAVAAWDLIKNVILGPILLLIDLVTGNISDFKSHLSQIWGNIKDDANVIWTALKNIVMSIVNVFVDRAKAIFNQFMQSITVIWNGMKVVASTVWNALVVSVTAIVNGFVKLAKSIFEGFKNAIINSWNAIKAGAIAVWAFITETIPNFIMGMVKKIINAWNNIKEKTKAAFDAVVGFIKDPLSAVDLFQIGKNIIQGLIQGIESMASAVWNKVKGIADGVKNAIKGALGIHSPSRYMAWIGEMTGAGFVKGLKSTVSDVVGQANKLAVAAVPFAGGVDMPSKTTIAANIDTTLPNKYNTSAGGHNGPINVTINIDNAKDDAVEKIKSFFADFEREVKAMGV